MYVVIVERQGVRKANNQGLVTTTAGIDLVHDLPVQNPTTVKVLKIMWSNLTGANVQLVFGTTTNAGVLVPMLPTIQAINANHDVIDEWSLPTIEWAPNTAAGAAGLTGDVVVQGSAAGVLIRVEVEEIKG